MNWRPILAALARLAALAVVVQAGTIWVCSRSFWTPIQCHYLPVYIWCSLPIITPATIEVRLIWKTRPHRKPELASEGDAVSSNDGTGMALSPWARDAGWTELIEGPPQQVAPAKLGPGLADLAFDGEGLCDFLLLPEACAMAMYLLVLFGWLCLKGWSQLLIAEHAWRRRVSVWREPSPSLLEECATRARRVCSRLRALHRSAAQHTQTRSDVTSTYAAVVEQTPKPAAFAFPLFGMHNETGEGGYLWSEKNEIE